MTTIKLKTMFKECCDEHFDAETTAKKQINFNTILEAFPEDDLEEIEWEASDLVLLLSAAVAE